MPPVGFEPVIPASPRPLGSAVSNSNSYCYEIVSFNSVKCYKILYETELSVWNIVEMQVMCKVSCVLYFLLPKLVQLLSGILRYNRRNRSE
jgi:hypothetical protein